MRLRFLMLIIAIIGVALGALSYLSHLWGKVLFPASLSLLWTIILCEIVKVGKSPRRGIATRDEPRG